MIARSQWMEKSTLALVLCLAGVAFGADGARILGENRQTVQRFAEADQLIRDGRLLPALDLYWSILNENATDLAPFDATGRHLLPARWLAHRRIADNPHLLDAFRHRVSGSAKELLDEGIAKRDPKRLNRLVDSMFCARETETALHWLGDLACERGNFAAARQYWMRLLPDSSSGALAFPSPTRDPALPSAKIVLSRMLEGPNPNLAQEIERLELRYPKSVVTLAGREGTVGDVLREIAASRDIAVGALPPSDRIATFAGNNARNGQVKQSLPLPEPLGKFPAVDWIDANSDTGLVQRSRSSAESLPFFPVVSQGHVLVADHRRVGAIDTSSGQWIAQFDLRSKVESLPRVLPSRQSRFTLTVSGNDVYARLGQTNMRSDRNECDSYIVALRFQPTAEEPLRFRWLLPANRTGQGEHAMIEGCPIVHDDLLYVATTRFDGNRAITEVACFDPTGSTPRPIWRQVILESGPDAADRSSQLLLCAADGLVICGPYNGAIVALESATGRRAWAFRYPPTATSQLESEQKKPLETCVAADGRLFAAPSDYDRLIALDLATGAPLWECGPMEAASILGVATGKVVVQTSGFISGMRAVDASTGRLLPDWGYAVYGSDAAAPLGRGLVFDDCVCWPTRADGIKLLNLDGSPEMIPAVFRSASAANLIYSDGVYVLATPNQFHVLKAAATAIPSSRRDVP